jgi:hypothetical protein
MMGWEFLIKNMPIMIVLIGGGTVYGEVKTDIQNLKVTQTAQYERMNHQLDNLSEKIDNLKK